MRGGGSIRSGAGPVSGRFPRYLFGLVLGLVLGLFSGLGCGDLKGFGGAPPPLVTFDVTFTGDVTPLRPPGDAGGRPLQVALVWGDQWQTEPFCLLPPESDAAAAVIAAGCRDPFGFVPIRVAGSVPLAADGSGALPLFELPGADVMIGDLSSRVAYGSLVVYDDRDGSRSLELAQPHRTASGGDDQFRTDTVDSADVVYGASFLTMTEPDQRVAYREGAPPTGAFYPRAGCDPPPTGFSVLAAGGFSYAAAIAAGTTLVLPPEDPQSCHVTVSPDPLAVSIRARAPAEVREVSCLERTSDSSVRYRQPPGDAPDLTDRLTACAHLPTFDAAGAATQIQLVVTGRSGDRCLGLTHYTLRGCRENVDCPVPDWDFTAIPPAWWPCPQ
jgi:hypothetical protein